VSELISVVQKQDLGSELVELFEVTVQGSTLYFHSGLSEGLTSIQFRDRESPSTIRTYTAFPIEMEGVDYSSDGAQNRPTLTVANVANTFSSAIGNIRNEDLVGERVVKRTTLKKYLYGQSGDASPPVEFPIKKFIIDRISSENNVAVTFELAAPFDLSGIQIPGRTIVGKYCSWQYQGNDLQQLGGCIWSKNSVVSYANGSGAVTTHKAYFTEDNEPIVPFSASASMTSAGWPGGSFKTYTTYSGGTPYSIGSYVEYNDGTQITVWKAIKATTGNLPGAGSIYWERGDICGKTIASCKARFQFTPQNPASSNSIPATTLNTGKVLPFGAFIGSMKFR
jgi:lambda family phage minor tail protein L